MTQKDRRKGRAEGSRPGARLPGWLVPVAAVVAALALAFAVDALYDTLQWDEEARIALARLSEDALEQQSVWREIRERGELTPEALGEVSEGRRDLREGLADFGRLDDGGRDAPIRGALEEAEAAFDEEARLIEEGRAREAAALREERTRPAFERLDELIDEAAVDYEGIVARTERVAGLGTYAAILLAAAALAALFLRHERSRRAAEREIEESRERYELAVRGANDGLWDWDLASGEVYFSPRWKEMLGYADHEFPNRYEEWERRIHPGDLPGVRGAMGRHLEGETPYYEAEYRLKHRDGRYRWVLARGASVRNGEGKPYRMAGSHTDVAERREAEEKLREAEACYRTLIEQIPVVTYVQSIDRDHATTYISPQLHALVGYATEEYVSDPGLRKRILHPEDRERVLAEDERTEETGEPFRTEYRGSRTTSGGL